MPPPQPHSIFEPEQPESERYQAATERNRSRCCLSSPMMA